MGNDLVIHKKKKAQDVQKEIPSRPSQWDLESHHSVSRATTFNNKFSLVICRNGQGKFLAVKETGIRGWWIPGGHVERREDFIDAAKR